MNKIALWINVCADDWEAEKTIIASNDYTENFQLKSKNSNAVAKLWFCSGWHNEENNEFTAKVLWIWII